MLKVTKCIWVKYFVEAFKYTECELKMTLWFKKILCKHSMMIRHSFKELLAKNSVMRQWNT